MKLSWFPWFLFVLFSLSVPSSCLTTQGTTLHYLLKSKRDPRPGSGPSTEVFQPEMLSSKPYIGGADGTRETDRIKALAGQPNGVNFDQYAGYVTVDPEAGRALFYYFVESPTNSSTKPLVLWLNGGPGCSSFGIGAMTELGPFRVNKDTKSLSRNPYAWNNVANVLFLESPAGVGFSYSNTTSDYVNVGDKRTAMDSYKFLVNWLERFPQYKGRDFFITGESYAGHYVPQLALTILKNNKKSNHSIKLKGIAIGNAWIDDLTGWKGLFDYWWTHAVNSDETNAGINKYCIHLTKNSSAKCEKYLIRAEEEKGDIDIYNIYAPLCSLPPSNLSSTGSHSVKGADPCLNYYAEAYLNHPEVQKALHTKPTNWTSCSLIGWTDSPATILPTIKQVIAAGVQVWIYSGDVDARVPVTASRYAINAMKIPVEAPWRPWYSGFEVGGYVVSYKGLTFATVREAGHVVPRDQPERALNLISSFLRGKLPPAI